MPIRWLGKYFCSFVLPGIILTLVFSLSLQAQIFNSDKYSPTTIGRMPPERVNKIRLKHLIIGEAVVYTTSMTGLYFLWYKDQFGGGFHSFNDWPEWQQMDKAGHFTTAYVLSELSCKSFRWTELNQRKSLKIGCLQSLLFMTSLEVLDGFSQEWGFSWSDMGFNLLGTSAFYISNLSYSKIDIRPKVSFARSEIAQYRPDLLGNNLTTSLLKDYNGQTYWLSVNLKKIINPDSYNTNDSHGLWSALCVSFGYGAHGMTGGKENVLINEQGQPVPEFQRFSQYYLSLDLDFSKLIIRNNFLRKTLNTLNFIKIPFPGLEFSRGKVFMNWTGYGM